MTVPQGRVRRTAPLVAMSARAAGDGLADVLRRRLLGKEERLEHHLRNAERYAEALSRSKGLLMKVGQLLSFVDLSEAVGGPYGAVYREALASLQSDAEPMAPELAAAVVERELGAPPEELFATFSPTPIAAASIGQVHAARLDDGREVAVKVQYPGVAEAIRDDLANTELLFTFVKIAKGVVPQYRNFDVRAIADEIAERLTEELDYRTELEHQAAFADRYRGHPFVRVPEVVPERSADRVLTMELVHGRRWSEIGGAEQRLRDRWGETIFRFFFGSMARLSRFNADPHPGNYLFHDDGSVTFLDFGCVKRATTSLQRGAFDQIAAALDGDGPGLVANFVEQGFARAEDPPPPDKTLKWYQGNFEPLLRPQPFTFTPDVVRDLLGRMTEMDKEVMRRVTVPKDYVFTNRLFAGLYSILGDLRATADWPAIFEEQRTLVPTTELGRVEAAFFAAQGAS